MPSISQFQQAVIKAEQSNGYLSINKRGNLVVKGTGFGGTIASWFRTKKGIQSNNEKVMQSFVKTLSKKYGKDAIEQNFYQTIKTKPLNRQCMNYLSRHAHNYNLKVIANNKSHALEKFSDQIAANDTQKAITLSRLEKIRDKREMVMNQPITVHDIHARSAYDRLPKGSSTANLGEFAYQNATNADSVTRINQHIDQLAQTANAWHEQQNFENVNGEKVLKDNAKNHITRLCTDEFAFWPKNKPLSNAEFLQIFSHVESTASQLKENLTLILASFPVEGADGKVHNTVMHVQCGSTPKINVFAKTSKSGVDANYANRTDLNNMAPTANLYEPASNREIRNGVPSFFRDAEKKAPALMPFMGRNGNAFAISRDNVVHVKTAGGAQCFDVVDICLDHEAGTGERNLTAELNERAKNLGLDMMPQQVSQVISSASILKSDGPNVSSIVLHADPEKFFVRDNQSVVKNPLQNNDLQTFDAIFGANNTQIKYGQLQVKDTHFGPPLEIEFYQPYSLENASKRVNKALAETTI